MNLMGELGIRHAVLVDKDNSPKHQKINSLIEESRNDYTLGVDYVENDIESYLGLERVEKSSQKPFIMMSRYDKGQIQVNKIEELINKIENIML